MLRVALTRLLANRLRFAMTGIAVVLGVAFLAGTLVLTDTISSTFDGLFANVYRGTDAVVRMHEQSSNSLFGSQRPPVSSSVLASVRAVPGVAAAEGVVSGYAQLVSTSGKAIGRPNQGAPTLGGSWLNDPRLNAYTVVAGGHPPRSPNQVVIDKHSADIGHLHVGGPVTVLTKGAPEQFTVVGLLRFGGVDSPLGASVALFDLPTAQRLIGRPGEFDQISVAADPGVSQTEVAHRLRLALHQPGIEVLTGAQIIAEGQSQVQKVLIFFNTFLLVFAFIALFVGAFIISNTFSIVLAGRAREHALLRSIGATRRQVMGSVVAESAALGVVASVIGLVAGIGLAIGLKGLLNAVGVGIPASGLVILTRTVVVSLLVGTAITVVASLAPGWRACRVPPIAALRDVAADTAATSHRRTIAGALLAVLGIAALFDGLFGHAGNAALLVGMGAAAVFLAVSWLGPLFSRPLSSVLGAPLARLRGITGSLARQNAMRNPRRTSSTASALMIGVALVILIDVIAASTKASVSTAVNNSMRADYVLTQGTGGAFGASGFSPDLAHSVAALPQVSHVAGVRFGTATLNGKNIFVLAADPAQIGYLWDVGVSQGSLAALGPSDLAVSVGTLQDHHWRLGQSVPMQFAATGLRPLTISAVYTAASTVGNYLLPLAAFEANFTQQLDSQVFVKLAPGVTPAEGRAAIKHVTAAYPNATIQDQAQYKADQVMAIDQVVNLVYVLLALAVIIALIGIANTLALSVVERTHELGLLRAVGMTRRQLRATVRWESVIIAVLGAGLGVVIGVFFGWSLVTALSRSASSGVTQLVVPYGQLITVVVLAGVAGVVAAVAPGRRAAKLDVLKAITNE